MQLLQRVLSKLKLWKILGHIVFQKKTVESTLKMYTQEKNLDNNNNRKCETVVSHMTISQVNNKIKAALLHFTLSLLCCCCCYKLPSGCTERTSLCVDVCFEVLQYFGFGWLIAHSSRTVTLNANRFNTKFMPWWVSFEHFSLSACLLKVLLFFGYFTLKTYNHF